MTNSLPSVSTESYHNLQFYSLFNFCLLLEAGGRGRNGWGHSREVLADWLSFKFHYNSNISDCCLNTLSYQIHHFPYLNLASLYGGALKGAVDAAAQFAKENPRDAAKMGAQIANSAGISPEYGISFASGFLETADLSEKWRRDKFT